jgi:tetraacyldisaccharide 4'-kinase
MLQFRGLTLEATEALPDHYDFHSWKRPEDDGLTLVCTEKDAAKLWVDHPDAWAVPLVLTPEPDFFKALDLRLDAKLSSRHGHQTS